MCVWVLMVADDYVPLWKLYPNLYEKVKFKPKFNWKSNIFYDDFITIHLGTRHSNDVVWTVLKQRPNNVVLTSFNVKTTSF